MGLVQVYLQLRFPSSSGCLREVEKVSLSVLTAGIST